LHWTAQERRLWLCAAVAASALACGCAVRQTRPIVALAAPAPEDTEVFYVTDRAESAPAEIACKTGEMPARGPRFGSDRQLDERISYGTYAVRLPSTRRFGEMVPYKPRPLCSRTPEDPVFRSGPAALQEEQFFSALVSRLEAAPGTEVFVFVHGYKYAFEESVLWTAQLKQDLNYRGAAVVFAWPSQGNSTGYVADGESIEWSTPHFRQFLEDLLAALPGRRVHILAHSLGARAVVGALQDLAATSGTGQPRLGQVVLAAPDIADDLFRQKMPAVIGARLAERITLYVSRNDKALRFAGRLHVYARAGDAENAQPLIPGLDIVDVTPADHSRYSHNYLFENRSVQQDVFLLLRDNVPPERRFGLVRLTNGSLTLWQLRP
jgi:esterase/lipase superfamily enzyme